ncbi:MAG TPA: hypothetical protein VFK50_10690 [Sphingomicrobium sp.]|nr:hypothetical protein [Sphingomicrobium sp.]
MFRAIRIWRTHAKARELAGLFAFEFLVVVFGVLTAQAVADWSADRAAGRAMLANKARADAQIGAMAATAIALDRAIPCMDERMITIMRAASAGETIDPAMLVRPVVRVEPYSGLTDESLLRVRQRIGAETAERYSRVAFDDQRLRIMVSSLAEGWQSLSIVSPETGTISQSDRQEARIVASRIRSHLRSVRQAQANISVYARDLGIKPRLGRGLRIPRHCAQLWMQNSVVFDPMDIPAVRDSLKPSA